MSSASGNATCVICTSLASVPNTGEDATLKDTSSPLALFRRRRPPERLGVSVVNDLVELIVSGEVSPGGTLPSEAEIADHFGVSRTVVRESLKRLEEKGLLQFQQGRRTTVNPINKWEVHDLVVLDAMIRHDDTLGILDDLSSARAALESIMASAAATNVRAGADPSTLQSCLAAMRANLSRPARFRNADVAFHEAVIDLSDNRLAGSIARVLIESASYSSRYRGLDPQGHFQQTLGEHERIAEALIRGDAEAAATAMDSHIRGSWSRRRLPVQGDV